MKIRVPVLALVLVTLSWYGTRGAEGPARDYGISPVRFTDVSFTDSFWARRLEVTRTVTIPFAFKQSEDTGRIKNFEIAGRMAEGAFCSRYAFDDSDVYKVIEGASYSLALHPDPVLAAYLDVLVAKIARAQEPDGYLYTARTINPANVMPMAGKARWINEEESHELYNAGHLYEAAVAHAQATGKRTLLEVAVRSADLIARTFGPDGLHGVPGHQEIEIGLVKLYRVTGDAKYLALAKFFLDQRGNAAGHKLYGEYAQDHLPVVKQTEAVGHAVRAAYMYSGMADLAALTGDKAYVDAIDRLWANVVGRKMYLTGGIGATGAWEGFGPDYDLPNANAYAETCASIANALWNQRMFLWHGDAKYIDVLERILYNGFLSGVAMTGDTFFYPNPLASFGQHERSPWFACACCPSNIPRFLASVPSYSYAVSGDRVYVNLFVQGKGSVGVTSGKIALEQETRYPWSGAVTLRVDPQEPASFTLLVRIPGWARNTPVPSDLYSYLGRASEAYSVTVNGRPVSAPLERGYLPVTRTWKRGDVVTIALPMEPRRVVAHPLVKADLGRVAVERGPVVYAAEWTDNGGYASNLILEDAATLTAEFRPSLLNGVTVVTANGTARREKGSQVVRAPQPITLIPYYAWAHRGKGEMAVWLARDADKARPVPEPSLASRSRASASDGVKGLDGVNDQVEPESSNDRAARYAHWWPRKNTTEWAQLDFPGPAAISESSVYWFEDTGEGECRVPASWTLLYRQGSRWLPVEAVGPYGTAKDRYNTVRFKPVQADAIRIEVQLPENFSAGIQEWKVR
jgi:DUF1680 family protein